MIEYSPRHGCAAVNSCRGMLLALRLQTFRAPLVLGLFAGALSAALTWYMNFQGEEGFVMKEMIQGAVSDGAYQISSSTLGVLLVFRTAQSYGRYNEGTRLIYQIMGAWFDSVSSALSFCHGSEAPVEEVERFRHTLIRLASICNAMMLADLEGKSTDVGSRKWNYTVIDAKGLDKDSRELILVAENKTEVIYQMLQVCLINGLRTRVMAVAPPLFQQVLADVAGAMMKFHEALKLEQVPFPFPYVAVTEVFLVAQTVLTPLVVSQSVDSTLMSLVLTFLVVFTNWSVSAIGVAMDNPFRASENDLDGAGLQSDFNVRLMSIFSVDVEHVATITDEAATAVHGLDGRCHFKRQGSDGSVHDTLQVVTHYLLRTKAARISCDPLDLRDSCLPSSQLGPHSRDASKASSSPRSLRRSNTPNAQDGPHISREHSQASSTRQASSWRRDHRPKVSNAYSQSSRDHSRWLSGLAELRQDQTPKVSHVYEQNGTESPCAHCGEPRKEGRKKMVLQSLAPLDGADGPAPSRTAASRARSVAFSPLSPRAVSRPGLSPLAAVDEASLRSEASSRAAERVDHESPSWRALTASEGESASRDGITMDVEQGLYVRSPGRLGAAPPRAWVAPTEAQHSHRPSSASTAI